MQQRTENAVILCHTRAWFETSDWSIERFAQDRLAPALDEAGLIEPLLEPATSDAYLKQRRAWGMRIGRIFNGTQPFPLEWKWVWLHALPGQHRVRAVQDLMAIAGSLYVPLPTLAQRPDLVAVRSDLSSLIQATGVFVAACKPAHDGMYSVNDDCEEVNAMMAEGLCLMERIAAELIALETGTGCALPRQRLLNALAMTGEKVDA